jgi:hypothetical protein
MTDNRDIRRPHGETGDTVQQAAEVSKPTKPAIDSAVPPADVATSADTGSDAMPGQSNAL